MGTEESGDWREEDICSIGTNREVSNFLASFVLHMVQPGPQIEQGLNISEVLSTKVFFYKNTHVSYADSCTEGRNLESQRILGFHNLCLLTFGKKPSCFKGLRERQ